MESDEKAPEGHYVSHWMAMGIVFGAGLGIPLSVVLGQPGLFSIGLPIGLALGAAIGQSKEKDARERGMLRPLTKDEQKRKKKGFAACIVSLALGVLAFLAFFYLNII